METRTTWLHDNITPDMIELHAVRRVLFSGKTKFQSVDVMETGSFGFTLVLDGKIQSTQSDEFIYHDALVHPAMITHPDPEKVFIAGGGEGATLREVLAHRTVRRAVMVDIDRELVDLCRQHLPSWGAGAFEDPRAVIHYTDARRWLEKTKERFDVIILDLPDPLEGGPAYLLFTREFYGLVRERLIPGGIIGVQAGDASYMLFNTFAAVVNTLKTVFQIVRPYQEHIPSFTAPWGFACASDTLDPMKLTPDEVDRRIAARLSTTPKCYDGLAHHGMLGLPRHIRRRLAATRRIIRDARPVYTY